MPILLGDASGIGLVSALVADGPGDWGSWATLALPAALSLYALRPRRA